MEMDYFNLEDAARVTGCRESELLYLVENEKLLASLWSKKREYCVLIKSDNPEQKGFSFVGTTSYRGILHVPFPILHDVIESGQAQVKLCICREGISAEDIQFTNPFKSPKGPFNGWKKLESPQNQRFQFLYPLPTESETLNSQLSRMVQSTQASLPESQNEIKAILDPLASMGNGDPVYRYDYSVNATFLTGNIRFTRQSLERAGLLEVKKVQNNVKLSWCESNGRHTPMDKVLERLFIGNPKKVNKELWKELQKADGNGENRYDTDAIIIAMGGDSIDWFDKDGSSKQLKFKTFKNKLSGIRKHHSNVTDIQ